LSGLKGCDSNFGVNMF